MIAMPSEELLHAVYLVATVLFIMAIKWLSSPVTAKRGVLAGEIAAALAVGATLFNPELVATSGSSPRCSLARALASLWAWCT